MKDRAPREHLVTGNSIGKFHIKQQAPNKVILRDDKVPNQDVLFIRSKFLNNARPLSKIKKTSYKKTQGFAKAIASCILLGESDYHLDNLMFSNDDKNILKIDHGRSFREIYNNFSSFVKATNINFNNFNYNNDFASNFNVTEFRDALSQMTKELGKEQINNMINQKLAELKDKKVGFDPRGIVIDYRINNEASSWKMRKSSSRSQEYFMDNVTKTITQDQTLDSAYTDLSAFYKNFLKLNILNTKEICNSLDIITKFDQAPSNFDLNKFKNGTWLKEIANFNCDIKDPVLFAAYNNILIEGKKPLNWAQNNNYKIKEYELDQNINKVIGVRTSHVKHFDIRFKMI